jgi:hypothetical protein
MPACQSSREQSLPSTTLRAPHAVSWKPLILMINSRSFCDAGPARVPVGQRPAADLRTVEHGAGRQRRRVHDP